MAWTRTMGSRVTPPVKLQPNGANDTLVPQKPAGFDRQVSREAWTKTMGSRVTPPVNLRPNGAKAVHRSVVETWTKLH